VTDWFLTSQCVFDQFRNMWSEPFLCKVKFRSGMFVNCLDKYEQGRFGAQSWSYNTPNSREIIAADCALLHVVSRRKDSLLLCLRIHCLTTEQVDSMEMIRFGSSTQCTLRASYYIN